MKGGLRFGYFMAFIIGALVVGYLLTQRGWGDSRDAKIILQGRGKWIAYAVAALILILLVGQSFIVIQAGTVGVVKRLGAVGSELNPGLHMIVPFLDRVVRYPTVKKTDEASDNPATSQADYPDVIITALTSDGQQIKVGITARFMIQPGKAAWILQNLGTEGEYVEKVVKTEIRGSGRRVHQVRRLRPLHKKKL